MLGLTGLGTLMLAPPKMGRVALQGRSIITNRSPFVNWGYNGIAVNEEDLLEPYDYDPQEYRVIRHTSPYTWVQVFWRILTLAPPVQVGGLGLDASKWQETINWSTAKTKVKFAYLRALFGLTLDTKFLAHWAGSKGQVKRGAYAYYLDAYDPEDQAQKLFDVLSDTGDVGELPMVADIEEIANVTLTPSKIKAYLEALEGLFGKIPVIYTGKWVWDTYIGNVSWALHYPLWIAQYPLKGWVPDHLNKVLNYPPVLPKPWTKWFLWQFTASAPAGEYGVSGNVVDLDYASPEFDALYLGGTPPIPGDDMILTKCLIDGLAVRSTPTNSLGDGNKIDTLGLNEEVERWLVHTETPTKIWYGIRRINAPITSEKYRLGYSAYEHPDLGTKKGFDKAP